MLSNFGLIPQERILYGVPARYTCASLPESIFLPCWFEGQNRLRRFCFHNYKEHKEETLKLEEKLKNLPDSTTGQQKYKASSNFAPRSLCIANNSILLTSHKRTLKKQVNKCNCEKYNDASKSKLSSSQGTCVHLLRSIFCVVLSFSSILKQINDFLLMT